MALDHPKPVRMAILWDPDTGVRDQRADDATQGPDQTHPGYAAGSIVLHSSARESVGCARSSTNVIDHMSLPFDAASRRLFGARSASTVSQVAGGHVPANDSVVVDTDSQGIGLQWSETSNTDDFAKNLIRARYEGRCPGSVTSEYGEPGTSLTCRTAHAGRL